MTARALRRDLQSSSDQFPQDVQELQFYFDDVQPGQAVKAIPGAGLHVPIWILGSSTYGAQVAAHFGLPYAFASHFAPDSLMQALHAYKTLFKPSSQQAKPHAGVGVNIVAADTDEQARYLFTTHQQHATRMRRNTRGQLPPPIDDIETFWTPYEKVSVSEQLSCSVVGSLETVRRGLQDLVEKTGADELIMAGQIFDHKARLRSFEIAAQAARDVQIPTALAA
jgi:luciferase family oxidoreductase group 1